MSGLFGGGTISTEAEKLATIRIQTSAYGRVIPVVYGTARIAGNLLWFADFVRTANTTQQKSGGIFGIGAVKTQNTTYNYNAAIALGLCEGPITGIGYVWSEKAFDLWLNVATKLGLSLFVGNTPQAVWSWLTSNHPGQDVPYDGIAFVASPSWPLDGNASLPNQSFEVGGFCQVGGGNVDANAGVIVGDILTNTRYGLAWDPTRLDLADFQLYCTAAGIFVSPAYTEQKPAAEVIKQLLQLSLADAIWSGGKLKAVPYADATIVGNGVSWSPPAPVFDLTDDDFLVAKDSGDPPVRMKRKQPSDVYNVVQVQHEPRRVANTAPPFILLTVPSYNTSSQEAKDDALIALYGERRGQPIAFPMIRDDVLARATAQRLLQRGTAVLNQYEFTLGWRYLMLEPMDWGYITDATLGLVRAAVRIIEVSESPDGQIAVVAEDYPGGGSMVPGTIPGGSSGGGAGAPNTYVSPGSVLPPVIFEAPGSLASTSAAELWIAVTGANPNWGGCNVWMSTDGGASYKKVAVQPSGSCYGVLTGPLAAWGAEPALDTTNTLAVALLGKNTTLTSVTAAEVAAGVTLCYVGGATREFLAFQTATLTGAAAYNLTTLARALASSTDGSHANGDPFARCDQTLVRIPFPLGFPVGTTVYFKFTSFNLFGSNEENLADVVAYPFTFQNIGGPAGGNTTSTAVFEHTFFARTNGEELLLTIPTAPTEFDVRLRYPLSFAGISSARLVAYVKTPAAFGTAIELIYSTDNGATWTPVATQLSLRQAGPVQSDWFDVTRIPANVWISVRVRGGSGTETAALASLVLQCGPTVRTGGATVTPAPPDYTGGMLWRMNTQLITPVADGTEVLTIANPGTLGGNFTNGSQFGSGPTYRTGQINGRPAIYFVSIGGNTRPYALPTAGLVTPTESHVFAVLKTAGGGAAWNVGGLDRRTLFPNAPGNVSDYHGSSIERQVPISNDPTVPFLYHSHGKASLWEAYVGLTQAFTTATNTYQIAPSDLGGFYGGGFFTTMFVGYIGEFRFYSGALTADQVLGIKEQMAADWGLSL